MRTKSARNPVKSTIRVPSKSPTSRHRIRRSNFILITAAGVLALVVLVQLVGSPIAKALVNRKLSKLPGYTGSAGAVRIELWRCGVHVDNLILRERGHENDPPIIHLKDASISLSPTAFFRGKVGGDMVVDGFELNVVKRATTAGGTQEEKREKKAGAKEEIQKKEAQAERWQDTFRNSFPLTLTKLEVKNSRIHFIDRTHQPTPEFAIEHLHLVATDLQNRPKSDGDPLPAKVTLDGITSGNGKLHSTVRVDPTRRPPQFAITFEIREMSLPSLNNFLLAYANADVSKGSFEVYSEINAQNGHYDGYLKPLFHDLDFRTASDRNKNAAELLAKKAVAAVASVLKNKEEQQVATKAPFAGNFTQNDVDVWTTIATLFRNAFVQALRGGFEGQTPRR